MRNSYGFAVVFGRPVSDNLLEWFKITLVDTPGINWYPYDSIHATLVNCTRPRARSVATADEALAHTEAVRQDALNVLLPCLGNMQGPTLHFQKILVTEQTIILPSLPSNRISDLKRIFQGGRPFVPKWEVESVLLLPDVLGINKYNTYKCSMQPTVHLTLGVVTARGVEILQTIEPPIYNATSLHLVFYRDRTLTDAIVSDPLMFDLPEVKQLENRDRIEEFFRRVRHTA